MSAGLYTCLQVLPAGCLVKQLVEWVTWAGQERDKERLKEILGHTHPDSHHGYWRVVYRLVLTGRLSEARNLLAHHSAFSAREDVSHKLLYSRTFLKFLYMHVIGVRLAKHKHIQTFVVFNISGEIMTETFLIEIWTLFQTSPQCVIYSPALRESQVLFSFSVPFRCVCVCPAVLGCGPVAGEGSDGPTLLLPHQRRAATRLAAVEERGDRQERGRSLPLSPPTSTSLQSQYIAISFPFNSSSGFYGIDMLYNLL